jgi:transketolase
MKDGPADGAGSKVELDTLSINTLRALAIDAVERANSGHPGMPLGAAPMAHALWTRHLKFDPHDPRWPDRDRFVLSAGHGSMLLYGLLHLAGFDLSLDELKAFRQWGSRTPGHPEYGLTPGVEATTGPLGAGLSNSVGMAVAERFLAAAFNRPGFDLVDHFTYGILGDGCLMEGVTAEAASLAGHLGLGRLIYLYDDNQVTIEGGTALAFTEDVGSRFEAYGWQVLSVADGNDVSAVERAIAKAKSETARPTLIKVRTTIGYGSPQKAGTAESHGAPLGAEEARLTKEALGWPLDSSFEVPSEVREYYREAGDSGAKAHEEWNRLLERYRQEYPELASQWDDAQAGRLPKAWKDGLPSFTVGEKVATRAASGKVLNAIAGAIPTLIGGSADLAPSTNTYLKGLADFQAGCPEGRNFRFGVREHAMGGVLNGMAYHGGLFPFGGTFFIFSDYMRPAIRLAALSGLPVIYVFTHDSVALGEDGPTHQPIEQLASLRAMPNLTVIRPSDAAETVAAWGVALQRREGPTALVLSRQALPVLDRSSSGDGDAADLAKGAYVLYGPQDAPAQAIVLATGSEVHIALAAAEALAARGIGARVVAMPSWELFEAQSAAYKQEILPGELRVRVAIEAAATLGWERYVGAEGKVIGLDRFGASAPADVAYKELGLTAENVVAEVLSLLGR